MGANISSSIEALCTKLDDFVSTKTVVGEAITIGDVVLLPLIDVSFGLGVASGEKEKQSNEGGGLGAKITPSAIIVVSGGNVQLINVKNQDAINKLVDMVPGVVNKLNFGSGFGKKAKTTEDVKFEEEIITE